MRDGPGRGTQSTVDRRWCRPKAPERSGALTGTWPPTTPVHGSSPTGAQQRDGSTGNSARVSVWRPGDGGEMAEEGELGNSGTHALGEGEE
jgi:hypothetical protein